MQIDPNSIRNLPPTSRSARIVHAAMATGVILFAIVAHFVLVPRANTSGNLVTLVPTVLAVAGALCGLSLLLLKRVARPLSEESTDAFWVRAATPALVTWAPLEAAALLCVVLYSQTASKAAIAFAAIAVILLVLLSPGYFEGR